MSFIFFFCFLKNWIMTLRSEIRKDVHPWDLATFKSLHFSYSVFKYIFLNMQITFFEIFFKYVIRPWGVECCLIFFLSTISWENMIVSSIVLQRINGASPDSNAPPYHQRCRLFNWLLIARWMVSPLFNPEDANVCMFSKHNFKFQFVWIQNSFWLCLSSF